jgi:hypothetical protein
MSLCDAEIGIGLTGFGVLFTFLGIIFFFDKGLLAMGNVSSKKCLHMCCEIRPEFANFQQLDFSAFESN